MRNNDKGGVIIENYELLKNYCLKKFGSALGLEILQEGIKIFLSCNYIKPCKKGLFFGVRKATPKIFKFYGLNKIKSEEINDNNNPKDFYGPDIEEEIHTKMFLERIKNRKSKKIVWMLLNGYDVIKMANFFGKSKSFIYKEIAKIRTELKPFRIEL